MIWPCYYGFSCNVNAIQMAAPIHATFHYGDGQTVTQTYTVKDYITAYDGLASQFDATTTALVHAIADYGHYVQLALADSNHWQYGVDYPVMDRYYTDVLDLQTAAAAVEPYATQTSLGTSEIERFNYSLNLLTRTELRIMVKPNDDYAGSLSFMLDGQPVEPADYSDGRYAILVSNIPAHRLDDRHTVTVTTASGAATMSLSPLSYVRALLKDNIPIYSNAVASLYYYYKAAEDYRDGH